MDVEASRSGVVDSRIALLREQVVALQDAEHHGSNTSYLHWYKTKYPVRRNMYRAAGIVVLLSGLAVPASLASGAAWWMIASAAPLLLGLISFFALKTAWEGYFAAQLQITHFLDLYKLALFKASREEDPVKAIDLTDAAVNELIKNVNQVILEETRTFFSKVELKRGGSS